MTIANDQEYEAAMARYQEIKYVEPGTNDHTEKRQLVELIQDYEQKLVNEMPDE